MARDLRAKIRVEADTREAERGVERVEGAFSRLSSFLKNRFVVTAGDAARALQSLLGAVEGAARLESQTEVVRRSLAAQGQAFDEFIAKLKEVSDEQVSTADLVKATGDALLLGIPADKIAELLEVARASAVATGTDISRAFADIATGIGRASPLILDNLGITVKLGEANEAYASELGKTVAELTAQEKQTALLNAVLETGESRVRDFTDAQTELSRTLAQGKAAMEDFRNAASSVAAGLSLGLGAVVTRSAQGFLLLGRGVAFVVFQITDLLARLPLVGEFFRGIADAALQVEVSLGRTSRKMSETIARMSEAADASLAVTLGLKEAASASDEFRDHVENAGRGADDLTDKLMGTTEAGQGLRVEFLEDAEALSRFEDQTEQGARGLELFGRQAGLTIGELRVLRAEVEAAERTIAGSTVFQPEVRTTPFTIGGGVFSIPSSNPDPSDVNQVGRA